MVGKTYRLTQDMKDAAAALELPLAKTALTLKQIYADAPGQAAVVWQLGARGREAAAEVEALFREVLPEACAASHRANDTRERPPDEKPGERRPWQNADHWSPD